MKVIFACIVLTCLCVNGCAATKPSAAVRASDTPALPKEMALPPDAAAALAKIKPDMKRDDVHAVVMPLATEYVDFSYTESMIFRTYAFSNGAQVTLRFNRPWKGCLVESINAPARRSRWDGRFEPTADEVKAAVAIATTRLQADLDAGAGAIRDHPSNPAGREEWNEQHRLPLNLKQKDGTLLRFVAIASGEYIKHRLIHLDLDSQAGGEHRVTVDMTDRIVVQTRWEPDAVLIAKLLPVAARARTVPADARHSASGEYDYGPTRRLITYWFEWEEPGNVGTSVSGVTLDADRGEVFSTLEE